MLSPSTVGLAGLPSPLRELLDRYRRAGRFDAVGFWEEIRRRGTPLRGNDPEDAIFLWRGAEDPQETGSYVHLHINRVTDKQDHHRGWMHHVHGTDIHYLHLRLPVALRAGYGFLPDASPLDRPRQGPPRFGVQETRWDPFSPSPPMVQRERWGLSVVDGPEAPDLRSWQEASHEDPVRGLLLREHRPTGSVPGATKSGMLPGSAPQREHWLLLPPAARVQGTEVPLLVVFDAETWFGDLPLPRALERAAETGLLPPMAVLGLANSSREDRVRSLGADSAFLAHVARDSVAWAVRTAARHGIKVAGPRRRILAGQSLGGLSALVAALELPEHFGAVLSHSPSMWWRPGGRAAPRNLGQDPAEDWITERFARTGPGPVRIRLDVGTREGLTVPHIEHLAEVLGDRGWEVSLGLHEGGHDFAWWRLALLEGLVQLLGPGSPEG